MLEILPTAHTVANNESNRPNAENAVLMTSVVVCSDDNLHCDLRGEAVVLNLKSGTYFGLNPLGARIWQLIQEPARVSDVHRQLLEEYEVERTQCEAELLSFLKQLQANNLITVELPNV